MPGHGFQSNGVKINGVRESQKRARARSSGVVATAQGAKSIASQGDLYVADVGRSVFHRDEAHPIAAFGIDAQ